MITQSASFYGVAFTMFWIGVGCGALLAYYLRSRYYDNKLFDAGMLLMYEQKGRFLAEHRIAELEARLDDLRFDGRP